MTIKLTELKHDSTGTHLRFELTSYSHPNAEHKLELHRGIGEKVWHPVLKISMEDCECDSVSGLLALLSTNLYELKAVIDDYQSGRTIETIVTAVGSMP